MSYEAEMYDGLEDLALRAIMEQEENSYYVVLKGNNHCKTLIDYPFDSIEEAREAALSYKGQYKTATITKGKPIGFEE